MYKPCETSGMTIDAMPRTEERRQKVIAAA